MAVWRADRVGSAHRGENPTVMARMRSGFAVIGDVQFLPGYSVLLTDDESADHLTDLDWDRRRDYLFDMGLLGEAIQNALAEHGLVRINYEVLGNSLNVVHAHVFPRYSWEGADMLRGPVWRYPKEQLYGAEHEYDDARHGELRQAIEAELARLMGAAYR